MNAQKMAPKSHRKALAGVNCEVGGASWTYSGERGVPVPLAEAGGVPVDDDEDEEDDGDVICDKREVDSGDAVDVGAGDDVEVSDDVVAVEAGAVDGDVDADSEDAGGVPAKLNPCPRRSTTQSLLLTFAATSPSLPSLANASTYTAHARSSPTSPLITLSPEPSPPSGSRPSAKTSYHLARPATSPSASRAFRSSRCFSMLSDPGSAERDVSSAAMRDWKAVRGASSDEG